MIQWALSALPLGDRDLVVTILREHEAQFQVTEGLTKLYAGNVRVVVLESPTSNQVETVAKTLERLEHQGPFLIKDSDNMFEIDTLDKGYNYVCVDSLNNHEEINPRNKSYVAADHTGLINNIREKNVISDTFSVGGYYFTDARLFTDAYAALSTQPRSDKAELYVSDIIGHLITRGIAFHAERVTNYHDWGTIHEWRKFLQEHSAIFVSLDGFVFTEGYRYFAPTFDKVLPNASAVDALERMAKNGNSIIYLTVRDESLAATTYKQIQDAGLPRGRVFFGCPNARWKFVTAPHAVLPFTTVAGIELNPSDDGLYEKIISI